MDEQEKIEPTKPPETEAEESEDLSIVEKIIGVYIAPVNTFRYLADHPDFWSPLIIVTLIIIAVSMAGLPKMMPLIESQVVEKMQQQFQAAGTTESEQATAIDVTLKIVRISTYVSTIIGTPIAMAVSWILVAALVFFVSLGQGLDTDFKRLLGMIPWLSMISIISQIISKVTMLMGSYNSMEELQDFRNIMPLSLIQLVPKSVDLPIWQSAFLGMIDPFFIWSTIVMVFALQYGNRCKRSQAIVTTIIVTLISLVIGVALTSFGMMMNQQK
jgi:hypothetical protein